MAELSARENKLIQYLNEAYGKERELETALQAHIGMTSRGSYKKRLQQHLVETRGHARQLERRIKNVGGTAHASPIDAPEPLAKGASAALELGTRAVAAAQGPLHAIRGTGEQERMLKNAKTEYANEHEEIATYAAIEALAQALSDKETAKLARSIRREEERMAQFLERLIPSLTKAVTQEEIPARERRPGSSSARRGTARRGGATKRVSSAKRRAGSSSRATSASRRSGSQRAGSASSRGKKTTSARTRTAASSRGSKAGRSRAASARSSSRAGSSRSGRAPKAARARARA